MKKKPIEERIIDGLMKLPNEIFDLDFLLNAHHLMLSDHEHVYSLYIYFDKLVYYKSKIKDVFKSGKYIRVEIPADFTKKFAF